VTVQGEGRRRAGRARTGLRRAAVLAVAAAVALGGCTSEPTDEEGPAGPGFDEGAESVELELFSGESVELNGAKLAVGGVGGTRATVAVTAESTGELWVLMNVGDTVDVPDWGALGVVDVVERGAAPSGQADDPMRLPSVGTVRLRAQLPGPYEFAVTVDAATAVVDSMLVELQDGGDAALVSPPGTGPVLVGARPTQIPGWGTAELVRDADGAGADVAVRFTTDHMPEVIHPDRPR